MDLSCHARLREQSSEIQQRRDADPAVKVPFLRLDLHAFGDGRRRGGCRSSVPGPALRLAASAGSADQDVLRRVAGQCLSARDFDLIGLRSSNACCCNAPAIRPDDHTSRSVVDCSDTFFGINKVCSSDTGFPSIDPSNALARPRPVSRTSS